MRRARRRTAALLTAVALPLGGCTGGAAPTAARPAATTPAVPSGTATGTSPAPRASTPAPSGATEQSPAAPTSRAPLFPGGRVDTVLAGMTREQQIAQLFLVGVPLGDVHRGDDLAAQGVGGIFLAGRSQVAAEDLARVTAAWQDSGGATGLWIAVDQEGGSVQTLSGPGFAELPAAEDQARLPQEELATLAEGIGASLDRAGINLDLAPVADVVPAGTEQSNEPIGVYGRQYGATTAEVSAAAGTVMEGLAEHGVTAVLKHFPGLGRVRSNTDTSEEVVDAATRSDDAQVELFAELAEHADTPPFIMTSSAVYAAIDDSQPAGWSDRVVDGLLREELGFQGVVVSDDVGAAAAVQDVPPAERAVRCLAAGGTLVLTVDPGLFPEMLAGVVARDRADDAFSERIDRAVRIALLAKLRAGLLTP